MSAYREKSFTDRQSDAASAKRAMLERAKAKSPSNDPAAAQRRAEREAVTRERDARRAERDAARKIEAERLEAERLASEAEARERAATEEADAVQREADLLAQQKAARDARYAARKARK
ncbi:DUF6481 family protein [Salinarimonas chemoclinalis]|uniref:DUF6481 family protein n=1 Tax=Salinarimonas chemoclinalis TaxID=3241599 RepID=UPI003555F978